MKKIINRYLLALLIVFSTFSSLCAQHSPRVYAIFDRKGHEVSFDQMISALSDKRVVFFGEMHNCPIAHWLEYEVAKRLFQIHKETFIMGAEMFECDNQLILDEYLQGTISLKNYESEMRLWDNYSTDYVKLIDLAKEHHLHFVATNVPRRYAQLVSRKGLDALQMLSPQAKAYLPSLPIPYQDDREKNEMFQHMGAMMGHGDKNPEFMTQAQAVKDATMAWHIARALRKHPAYMLHFNGTFHSDNSDGIIPFLQIYDKSISFGTISTCRQEDLSHLEEISLGRADFIICISEDMVYSY